MTYNFILERDLYIRFFGVKELFSVCNINVAFLCMTNQWWTEDRKAAATYSVTLKISSERRKKPAKCFLAPALVFPSKRLGARFGHLSPHNRLGLLRQRQGVLIKGGISVVLIITNPSNNSPQDRINLSTLANKTRHTIHNGHLPGKSFRKNRLWPLFKFQPGGEFWKWISIGNWTASKFRKP